MVRHHRVVVIGSGIAGLTAALRVGDCAVVTKTSLGEGSSRWAQGGVAAAIAPNDAAAAHGADTLVAGRGLSDPVAVEAATTGGPAMIAWLRNLGADFDTDADGNLLLGREAGHSVHRIVHANGDATGAEIMRALRSAVLARADIALYEDTVAVDLVRRDDRVCGVLVLDIDRRPVVIGAECVVLATGGMGRLYAATTNPPEATGDGLAMALRAGAVIRDPELVQFHPTALDTDLDPRPLLTEALRGAGAHLLDSNGYRYMTDVHPDAELAPRDVVARANWRVLRSGPALLDLRHIADLAERFPTAVASARRAGLDPAREPLPITPAQHYHMGGVRTDGDGRTSLGGLYACGEVASTGLHGANRLASNSLLEGLVFGARVAAAIARDANTARSEGQVVMPRGALEVRDDDPAEMDALRRVMWDVAGLVRDEAGLRAGLATVASMAPALGRSLIGRNMIVVASAVLSGALEREESRGSHYRVDHPVIDPGEPRSTMLRWEPVDDVLTLDPSPMIARGHAV